MEKISEILEKHGCSRVQSYLAKSFQDASKTAWVALQMAPRWPPELQDGPGSLQDASRHPSRTAPSVPKTPPRLSKSLQDGSGSLQDASKGSPEEVLEPQSRLQELSRGAFQASSCWPAASSLWPASGLGGIHEAQTIAS